MRSQALPAPRFVRQTRLGPNEYRKNFHQIDREVVAAVTSPEADRVTPLMGKIYLRLVNAPERYWEREGVLRVAAEQRGETTLKSWAVLCELLGVASATANKALAWMHEQGIIGYFSGKNGAGLRIFLNRATSSIGVRGAAGAKKILDFPRASFQAAPASPNEAAFNVSFAGLESLDSEINRRAPKNGADESVRINKIPDGTLRRDTTPESAKDAGTLERVVTRLKAELEPALRAAARQAAAHEHERTREWLEKRGLPKAARVAQHEAYNVLRGFGMIREGARGARAGATVGRAEYAPQSPRTLSDAEVEDMAGACVAMFEIKGQPVEQTLSEIGADAGGFMLPADAARVRERACALLSSGGEGK